MALCYHLMATVLMSPMFDTFSYEGKMYSTETRCNPSYVAFDC